MAHLGKISPANQEILDSAISIGTDLRKLVEQHPNRRCSNLQVPRISDRASVSSTRLLVLGSEPLRGKSERGWGLIDEDSDGWNGDIKTRIQDSMSQYVSILENELSDNNSPFWSAWKHITKHFDDFLWSNVFPVYRIEGERPTPTHELKEYLLGKKVVLNDGTVLGPTTSFPCSIIQAYKPTHVWCCHWGADPWMKLIGVSDESNLPIHSQPAHWRGVHFNSVWTHHPRHWPNSKVGITGDDVLSHLLDK
jgi:hypothetical protein